jgi:CspA family cold shock protein
MFIVKSLVISIIIGLLGYEITKFFMEGGLVIPATATEIVLLCIFIGTALAANLLGGGTASSESSSDRESGTVKWFNVRKGYGFITRDQGEDIFVHFKNLEGTGRRAISEGERVTFIVTTGDKGLQADKVKAQ